MAAESGKKIWDPYAAYDISPEERRLIEERGRQRANLKAEWQKKITNPHRPGYSMVVSCKKSFVICTSSIARPS